MQHATTIEALIIFLISLLALLGVEYSLLVRVDATWLSEVHRSVQLGSKLVLAAGTTLRATTVLTYITLVRLLIGTNPSVQKRPSVPQWVTMVASAITIITAYILWTIASYEIHVIYWLYPTLLLMMLVTIPVIATAVGSVSSQKKERSEQHIIENEHSIHIKTRKGYINVPNPYRGSLVIGSSGSGKSASIGNAYLHQFVQKGFCGIVYDFKFPTLANVVNTALHRHGQPTDLTYYLVNFQDPQRSHRCNPLAPDNIPTSVHAEEYARAVVNNLDTNTIKHREFFANSAIAWLAALIWFYRSEHPEYCTLPHVINTVLYHDYAHVISMLEANPQSADMIRSVATAIQKKADKQIAGVIASLQIIVTRINSPEMVWSLTGDDFDMNINDPANPKLLCLGSDPGLVEAYSPVISLIITVALKQMNQQGKRKSFVLLDEAPTLYIPKFEVIPATARSNRIASVYLAQDIAQMVDMFGREKADVIVANLSNQFYGKVSSVQTAKIVSEMIGKEEQVITNHSQGSSRGSKGNRNLSHNVSTSQQERLLVKPQEVMQLQPGEFIGQTVESTIPYFRAQTRQTKTPQTNAITTFSSFGSTATMNSIVQANFQRVRKEVATTLQRYPNLYQSS